MSSSEWVPYLVAVNLTRRCNLGCSHCYLDANTRLSPREDELSLGVLREIFASLATRAPGAMVVLTGGEPLLRGDIEELVRSGNENGLRMVLGTNGVLLSRPRILSLKAAGLQGVGISLDDTHPLAHNAFRGMSGSFEKSCDALRTCAEVGLHAQVHFTVTRQNQHEIEDVVMMARDLGASLVNFFFLVCVGRAAPQLDLSAEAYEHALMRIAKMQRETTGILIQSRCTPHFKRILYEANPESAFTRAQGYDGGGCPAATHYCRITPEGEVTPCPYMELSGGNIHHTGFWDIWDSSTLFQSFRNPDLLQGRCGGCEYKALCGGCRARALAQSGNLMAEDPNCHYVPTGAPVIPRLQEKELALASSITSAGIAEWTPEAKARLDRIPLFLRAMLRKRLEARAQSEGVPVTVELMHRHRQESQAMTGLNFDVGAEAPKFVKALLKTMPSSSLQKSVQNGLL